MIFPAKTLTLRAIAAVAGVLAAGGAFAQMGQERSILTLVQKDWIAFRNYDGRQLIYFTTLVSWRCGISEIRYAINGQPLDQIYLMPPCNPDLPNNIPGDFSPYLSYPAGTATEMAVRITYADGTISDVGRYAPCPDVSDATCARYVAAPRRAGQF